MTGEALRTNRRYEVKMNRTCIAALALLLVCIAVMSHGQNQATDTRTMLDFLRPNDIVTFMEGSLTVWPKKQAPESHLIVKTIGSGWVILRSPEDDVEVIVAKTAIQQIGRVVGQ